MRKIIFSLSTITALTTLLLIFNIAGGDEGETAGGRNNKEQKTEETHSGGWQLQVMPNMGNRLVRDLYFTDSLTGYAVASPDAYLDSAHILKTTNGGFNWSIKHTKEGKLNRVIFLNVLTGFAGGDFLLKTTNSGENWIVWNWGPSRVVDDMAIFSEDTIWYGYSEPISGGVYRTTNGGLNWEKRDNGIPTNSYPDKLYFYNSRIGFAYQLGNPSTYKTTNGGISWNIIYNGGFAKLEFVDSLKGYRAAGGFHRTTNGGLNWSQDSLPTIIGNTYTNKGVSNFTKIDSNIIYCAGGNVYYYGNGRYKATIYKTTNGGINWGYQIPDTNYDFFTLTKIFSLSKNNVWLYSTWKGIYSSTGGDTTIYVGVKQISSKEPDKYELKQNYPNPFNSMTNIKFEIPKVGQSSQTVSIKIFDITGRELQTLVNEKLNNGTYKVRFYSANLPSGIYFYQMKINDNIIQTRKMIFLK